MDCNPQTLLNNAACFQCGMSPGMQQAVLIYLMCQIAQNGGGGGGGGATAFTGLSDTPHSYVGAANELVTVNSTATGLNFTPNFFTQQAVSGAFIGGVQNITTLRGPASVDIQGSRINLAQVASGQDALAIGGENTASGKYSTVVGYNNTSSGNRGVAIGYTNTASSNYTIAIGINNSASNNYNGICIGNSNIASGAYSVLMGSGNVDAGYGYTLSFGANNTATAGYSLSVGSGNSTGNQCISIGIGSTSSNAGSMVLGLQSQATGQTSVALGYQAVASGYNGLAFGLEVKATGKRTSAFGFKCTASGYYSNAIGYISVARIQNTTTICGPIINRKDNAEGANFFTNFGGVEVVLFSDLVDFKALATHTITLPAACHFYPNECGIVANSVTAATVQPTVSFGITGTNAALLAAAPTTGLTANYARYRAQTLLTPNGQTSLTGTVTVVATATTLQGRYYFKGLLLEDN